MATRNFKEKRAGRVFSPYSGIMVTPNLREKNYSTPYTSILPTQPYSFPMISSADIMDAKSVDDFISSVIKIGHDAADKKTSPVGSSQTHPIDITDEMKSSDAIDKKTPTEVKNVSSKSLVVKLVPTAGYSGTVPILQPSRAVSLEGYSGTVSVPQVAPIPQAAPVEKKKEIKLSFEEDRLMFVNRDAIARQCDMITAHFQKDKLANLITSVKYRDTAAIARMINAQHPTAVTAAVRDANMRYVTAATTTALITACVTADRAKFDKYMMGHKHATLDAVRYVTRKIDSIISELLRGNPLHYELLLKKYGDLMCSEYSKLFERDYFHSAEMFA